MKFALVYQAGIANVFEVENYGNTAQERGTTIRRLQHAFVPCEWFCRGAREAGATVRVFGCNMAGDIREMEWCDDRGPFRDKTCFTDRVSDRHFT